MSAVTPILSRSAHDRIAVRRADEEWVAQRWQDERSRVLVLSAQGKVEAPTGAALTFRAPQDELPAGITVLLGEHGGVAYFGLLAGTESAGAESAGTESAGAESAGAESAGTESAGAESAGAESAGEETSYPGWANLRELAVLLSPLDSGLMTAAVALQAWHQSHTHCPRCGSTTEPVQAGWVRRCVRDGSQHFPRTDPAVIMLIEDDAGRCLLGRSSAWPPGRFSTLAGFVEAGESAEAAVAREVGEEVGVAITDIRYFASQPHPFPASLMLGFTARLSGDPTIRIDNDEIADAGWFSRHEVRRAVDWGEAEDESAQLRALPPQMSIARQLIETWLSAHHQ